MANIRLIAFSVALIGCILMLQMNSLSAASIGSGVEPITKEPGFTINIPNVGGKSEVENNLKVEQGKRLYICYFRYCDSKYCYYQCYPLE